MGGSVTDELIKLLVEAYTNEKALIKVLGTHLRVTDQGEYRSLVERHLKETRRHASKLISRLETLGYRDSLGHTVYQFTQNAAKQAIVVGKAPADLLRGGTNKAAKMLRNAMDQVMSEGLEIGAYDAIESFARTTADHETADLAAEIRLEEERMFEGLRKQIPGLAAAVAESRRSGGDETDREPWPDYDEMNVQQVVNRLAGASPQELSAVRAYEPKNKNRSTVLKALE